MAAKKKGGGKPKKPPPTPSNASTQPQFVMDGIKLLLNDLTSPETGVKYIPPSRANPATIQGNIHPPAIKWNWPTAALRQAMGVGQDDVGTYGLQADANVLFRLTSAAPVVWQPVQMGTTTTWTWQNLAARQAEKVTPDDVGKIGVQTDRVDIHPGRELIVGSEST